MKQNEIQEHDIGNTTKVFTSEEKIKDNVDKIRRNLKSICDGEISISPYDTAWVALVQDIHGNPQFPSSLQWIVDHQLPDGSWGDNNYFLAHDRLINTLACLIALKSWNVYPENVNKGIAFLDENINKLHDNSKHMLLGFDVAFPAMVEIAQTHGIQVFQDSSAREELYAKRNLKISMMPIETLQEIPTFFLHSLEVMTGLDWEKLLKLQSKDGSFMFSPSSTAYAFMQTRDEKCLAYLRNVVQRFKGGVPHAYPIDLFERIFVIDRLERLGISQYFQEEINECMTYISRHWTERGLTWTKYAELADMDDTSMAFRLLRLHGYEVSADVFNNFEKDGEFYCYVGQPTQEVSETYNLLRASQLQYPGEEILDQARCFTSKYLRGKQASNELLDNWSIPKDLQAEVTLALDVPWYASLPSVETRFYIEQYGGAEDLWIAKVLYRMPHISNNDYLALAKSVYNKSQELHRVEWKNLVRWHSENNLGMFGVTQKSLLQYLFLAAATLLEPEKSNVRLAWAKTICMVEAFDLYFRKENASVVVRRDYVISLLQHSDTSQNCLTDKQRGNDKNEGEERLVKVLISMLKQLTSDTLMTHGKDIGGPLQQAWEKWLRTWEDQDGYKRGGEAELLVYTIELCAGRCMCDDQHTLCILEMTISLCNQLGHLKRHNKKVGWAIFDKSTNDNNQITKVLLDLQKFTELVFSSSSNGVPPCTKQTCLAVVKTFYYSTHCSPEEIDFHIDKVLFQKVD